MGAPRKPPILAGPNTRPCSQCFEPTLKGRKLCRPCDNARMRQYQKDKRDEVNAKNRRWYSANLEYARWYNAKKRRLWVINNREYWLKYFNEWQRQWRIKNAEQHRERARLFNQLHPDKVRAIRHLRRARAKNAPGRFTAREFRQIVVSQDSRCFDCRAVFVRDSDATVGHLWPLSRGGTNWAWNIVAQCMPCNHRQYTRIHPRILETYKARSAPLDHITAAATQIGAIQETWQVQGVTLPVITEG